MSKTILFLIAITVAAAPVAADAARITLTATEIATIAPANETVSPRILVKWSLPEVLMSKSIEAAAITITVAVDGKGPLSLDVMPLSQSWTATDVAWSSGWQKEGGDFDEEWAETAIATDRNSGELTINVRTLVEGQVAGNRSNFGFILVPEAAAQSKLQAFTANAAAKLSSANLTIVCRTKR